MDNIPKPDVNAIKKVELRTKWYPLTKHDPSAHILCPEPSKEEMESVKNRKKSTVAEKQQAKKRKKR